MRRAEVLCYRCVHPFVLNYRRCSTVYPYVLDRREPWAGPPSNVHGEVADRNIRCTRCGDEIPKGRGYVSLQYDVAAERRDPPTTKSNIGKDASTPSRLGLVGEICTTALGIVLALAPLALWLAPTAGIFFAILIVTISAVIGLWLLDAIGGDRNLLSRLRLSRPAHGLPDGFIAELLKLLPNTHHNRLPGDPEYQRKIDRLKKLLPTDKDRS